MKILLDECLDRKLGRLLAGLALAEFVVFLTVDRNLSFQQNLPRHAIAVVVMRATSNRLADLLPLVPKILAVLQGAPRGAATIVQ